MMEIIGKVDDKDMEGNSFYGNFYVGLYYDSIDSRYFAQTFLAIPAASTRYEDDDMWYHLPRVLFTERGYQFGELK